MPHLASWLALFGLPSLVAIAATYVTLRVVLRADLAREQIARKAVRPRLARAGRWAGWGIAATSVPLLVCSCARRLAGPADVSVRRRDGGDDPRARPAIPWALVRHMSWGVLPLVAGLVVLVEAVDGTGLIAALAVSWMRPPARRPPAPPGA